MNTFKRTGLLSLSLLTLLTLLTLSLAQSSQKPPPAGGDSSLHYPS